MFGLSSENDPSRPPPDTSISAHSSFEKIRLRVRPPCCQLSPETIDSSLVTVIHRDEIPISNIDSLDDVSSLPHDTPDFMSEPSSSLVLRSTFDGEGKPTAGIRLELPPELLDTVRLLSRFGTRLRARHGVGTFT